MTAMSAIAWYNKAAAAAQGGDRAGARAILADALGEYPNEARLWHGAGKMLLELGQAEEAARHFGKAFELEPGQFDFAVDQAIALSAAARHHAALAVLAKVELQGAGYAHYCSTRANAERGAGNAAAAAKWYDRALTIEPARPKALHGRASVALERGEADALARFERALQGDPGNPFLWLGRAQALDVEGRIDEARAIAEQLAQQAPSWLEGLKFLSQLRLAAGEKDFTAPYREAAKRAPQDPNIPTDHCAKLASLDHAAEAADVAAEARQRFPDMPYFAFLEAVHAGSAGDDDRAEAIFAELVYDTTERYVHEARHWIRRGDASRADALLDRAIAAAPWDIGAWALRGFVWRMLDDARGAWLHEQAGLVQLVPLRNADSVLAEVIPALHKLHDGSAFPLGQSLRGGTQTRGRLFDRAEPEIATLHQAIQATLEDYRAALPPRDDTHPLLRHREAPWRITGSWSVRLTGGGDYHTAHIHPEGIVSSALYLQLPPDAGSGEANGWLEIGRPPPDLRLDLEPLRTIEPRLGHLALFPSTLYHGTTPFGEAQRMTVAFDVTSADRQTS